MNRKQFGFLLVLLIVLGGAGWLLTSHRNHEENAGEQGTGQKLMGDAFPVNDIAQISIHDGSEQLDLVKRDDLWRVSERHDYPASFSDISEFLLKLRDLKVIQNDEIGASQLARLQLASPGQGTNSGTVVDLKDKDGKSIRSFTLGKKLMRKREASANQFGMGGEMADGRYVMLSGNATHALVISDALDKVVGKPENWVDKTFFKIERPKAISVTYPVASNSWAIDRETESGEWKFSDAKGDEKLDQARASGVSNPFSSPSFNDVLPPDARADEMAKATVVKVDTFDDFTYVVKVGAKFGQEYPITVSVTANFPKERTVPKDEKPAEKDLADKAWAKREKDLADKLAETKRYEKWVYLVPSWSVDQVLKERKDLVAEKEKKDDTKPGDKPQALTAPPVAPVDDILAPPEPVKQ